MWRGDRRRGKSLGRLLFGFVYKFVTLARMVVVSGCLHPLGPVSSLRLPGEDTFPCLLPCSPPSCYAHQCLLDSWIIPQPPSYASPSIPKPMCTYPTLHPAYSPNLLSISPFYSHLSILFSISNLYTAPQKWAKASEETTTLWHPKETFVTSPVVETHDWEKSERTRWIPPLMPWALKVLREKQRASQINPLWILNVPSGWRTKRKLAFAEE